MGADQHCWHSVDSPGLACDRCPLNVSGIYSMGFATGGTISGAREMREEGPRSVRSGWGEKEVTIVAHDDFSEASYQVHAGWRLPSIAATSFWPAQFLRSFSSTLGSWH